MISEKGIFQHNLPTTDMTERRLDVLIAGTGLLYGSSNPRKRKRHLRPKI